MAALLAAAVLVGFAGPAPLSRCEAASFQASGRLTLTAECWLGSRPQNRDQGGDLAVTTAGVTQNLDVSLLAAVPLGTGRALQVTCDLAGTGYWGVNYPSDGSYGYPPTSLLPSIDQLYAAYATESFSVAAGRFRPSLDPGGLVVSDPYPLEGVMLDSDLGRSATATLLWSRLSSEYDISTPGVVSSDELVAVRAVAQGKTTLGGTLVLSELAGSRAAELDASSRALGFPLTVEVAAYQPSSTFVDAGGDAVDRGEPAWSYAALARSVFDLPGRVPGYTAEPASGSSRGSRGSVEVTAGFAQSGFTPVFTDMVKSGLVPELPFRAGCCGASVKGRVALGRGWTVESGFSLTWPLATAGAAYAAPDAAADGAGVTGGGWAARLAFHHFAGERQAVTADQPEAGTGFSFGLELGPVQTHALEGSEEGSDGAGGGDAASFTVGRLFASWSVEL